MLIIPTYEFHIHTYIYICILESILETIQSFETTETKEMKEREGDRWTKSMEHPWRARTGHDPAARSLRIVPSLPNRGPSSDRSGIGAIESLSPPSSVSKLPLSPARLIYRPSPPVSVFDYRRRHDRVTHHDGPEKSHLGRCLLPEK